MNARAWISVVILCPLIALTSAVPVEAMGGRGDDDRTVTEDGFRIQVFRPGGGGSSPADASCSWRHHEYLGSVTVQGVERVDSDGYAYRTDPDTGDELTMYSIGGDCPYGLVWVPTSLTPRSLIPSLRARVERVLPEPTPDISPPPEAGTYMNLGIWLAVTDPGVTSERVAVGPVWASARGELVGFTVDFGNGDSVYCDGIGVPIDDVVPDHDTLEEGPCGYTYGWPDKRGKFEVTITSSYTVTYRLSNGESGVLGDVDRTTSFPYDVAELITVGVNN